MTLVKNINGTSTNNCSCGSWLKHWENFSGEQSLFCSVQFCNELASDGAHVQKANSVDDNWYIVPMCKKHNLSKNTLLSADGKFVSASKEKTCS